VNLSARTVFAIIYKMVHMKSTHRFVDVPTDALFGQLQNIDDYKWFQQIKNSEEMNGNLYDFNSMEDIDINNVGRVLVNPEGERYILNDMELSVDKDNVRDPLQGDKLPPNVILELKFPGITNSIQFDSQLPDKFWRFAETNFLQLDERERMPFVIHPLIRLVVNKTKDKPNIRVQLEDHGVFEKISDYRNFYDKKSTPLQFASYFGPLKFAQTMVSYFPNNTDLVNDINYDNRTAMHFAALGGHLDILKFLLANGGVAHFPDKNDTTPLLLAVVNGDLEAVQLLAANGASLVHADRQGKTPIYLAAANGYLSIVQWLLKQNQDNYLMPETFREFIDVNKSDKDGVTPLYVAVGHGHLEVVKLLAERGASVVQAEKHGWTPLFVAAAKGYLLIMEWLAKTGASIEQVHTNGDTLMHTAAYAGQLNVMDWLAKNKANVNQANYNGETPLYGAAMVGHLQVVQWLTMHGADSNLENNDWKTPLYIAVENGHFDVVKWLWPKTDKSLLLDPKNPTVSILHRAAMKGHTEIVRWLVEEKKVDVNLKSAFLGYTALHLAIENKQIETIRMLVRELKANIDIKDNDGRTPLDLAKLADHVPQILNILSGNEQDPVVSGGYQNP